MAWTVHKPSDCKLGKKHKDDQKKDRNKANLADVASAATATISPRYTALLATLANNRGRMMVCTSMHLEFVVGMHGWAIKHRTTNHDLPFNPTPSYDHLCAVPPCLPHQELGNDDPQDGSLAPQGKTSRCST
jgi:hypothetical protein